MAMAVGLRGRYCVKPRHEESTMAIHTGKNSADGVTICCYQFLLMDLMEDYIWVCLKIGYIPNEIAI